MQEFLHDLDWVLPLRQEWLTPVFVFFTLLGYTGFFLVALPLLYWIGNARLGNRIAIPTVLAAMVMYFCKDFFQDPRPPEELALNDLRPDSYGLPSGHTMIAIVFWWGLAREIRKRWFWIVALILVPLIAFSRLYLGVHDVEDILGGAILGLILLGISTIFCTKKWSSWTNWIFPVNLTLAVLVPAIALAFWPDDTVSGGMFLLSGFLPGWIAGHQLQRLHIQPPPLRGWRAVAGTLLGLAILWGLQFLLKLLLGALPVPESLAQILAGAVFGLAIPFAIPAILQFSRITKISTTAP